MPATATRAAPSVTGQNAAAQAAVEYAQPQRRRDPRKKSAFLLPKGFSSPEDFLRSVRESFTLDYGADEENRREAKLDMEFMAGQQWEAAVVEKRTRKGKPVITVNMIPAMVAQLVGNSRLSSSSIKISPERNSKKSVAKIREGLIRNIQKVSNAQLAFDKAFENQVISGIGAFQIHLDYAYDDVFEQDIRIAMIPDAASVVWDASSVDPSGADAHHVFVLDRLSRADFKQRYPAAQGGDFSELSPDAAAMSWDDKDSVQVVSYWQICHEKRLFAMLSTPDGKSETKDVTDSPEAMWFDRVMERPNGDLLIREVMRPYAEMYLITASDILAGPYRLPISRVPVVRMPGWEIFVGGKRTRWGMVRFVRDPQRLLNYWRSVLAENLVKSPKSNWIATAESVQGYEKEWRESHLTDDPLLRYNGTTGAKPERAAPAQMEPALLEQAGLSQQDIRNVANMHESSYGEQSNEVSGKAVVARQRVAELGTVIYSDNRNYALEQGGKIINELIPFSYDSARVIKVLGPDMVKEEEVSINDPDNPESEDITEGKYSVSVITGPSYATQRIEAREEIMAFFNANPEQFSRVADLLVENMDWPGAEEIARRFRMMLPPGTISEKDLTDEEKQQMAAAQQQAQQQQEIQQQAIMLELQDKQATADLKSAQSKQALAQATAALAQARLSEANAEKAIASITTDDVKADAAMLTAEARAHQIQNDIENPPPAPKGAK